MGRSGAPAGGAASAPPATPPPPASLLAVASPAPAGRRRSGRVPAAAAELVAEPALASTSAPRSKRRRASTATTTAADEAVGAAVPLAAADPCSAPAEAEDALPAEAGVSRRRTRSRSASAAAAETAEGAEGGEGEGAEGAAREAAFPKKRGGRRREPDAAPIQGARAAGRCGSSRAACWPATARQPPWLPGMLAGWPTHPHTHPHSHTRTPTHPAELPSPELLEHLRASGYRPPPLPVRAATRVQGVGMLAAQPPARLPCREPATRLRPCRCRRSQAQSAWLAPLASRPPTPTPLLYPLTPHARQRCPTSVMPASTACCGTSSLRYSRRGVCSLGGGGRVDHPRGRWRGGLAAHSSRTAHGRPAGSWRSLPAALLPRTPAPPRAATPRAGTASSARWTPRARRTCRLWRWPTAETWPPSYSGTTSTASACSGGSAKKTKSGGQRVAHCLQPAAVGAWSAPLHMSAATWDPSCPRLDLLQPPPWPLPAARVHHPAGCRRCCSLGEG